LVPPGWKKLIRVVVAETDVVCDLDTSYTLSTMPPDRHIERHTDM